MSGYISGNIRVGWSMSERDLGIDKIQREMTMDELRTTFERIEGAITRVIGDGCMDVHIDGDDKEPVRIYLNVSVGMNDMKLALERRMRKPH